MKTCKVEKDRGTLRPMQYKNIIITVILIDCPDVALIHIAVRKADKNALIPPNLLDPS
jgi:hypothetical protein